MDFTDQLRLHLENTKIYLEDSPHISLTEARNALQISVNMLSLIVNLEKIQGESLFNLISRLERGGHTTRKAAADLHYVRRAANPASHGQVATRAQAEAALAALESAVGWILLQELLKNPKSNKAQTTAPRDPGGDNKEFSERQFEKRSPANSKSEKGDGETALYLGDGSFIPIIPLPENYSKHSAIWVPFIDVDSRKRYIHIGHDWEKAVHATRPDGCDLLIFFDDPFKDNAELVARFANIYPVASGNVILRLETRHGTKFVSIPPFTSPPSGAPTLVRSFKLKEAFPIDTPKRLFTSLLSIYTIDITKIPFLKKTAIVSDEYL